MEFKGVMSLAVLTFFLGLSILPFTSSSYNDEDQSSSFDDENGIALNPSAIEEVSHDLEQGYFSSSDWLLSKVIIRSSWKFFGTVTKLFKFPVSANQDYIINYISVRDLRRDGTGGYPSIISGGVGRKEVTIELKSQFMHGFDFNITLYGWPS